MTGEVFDPGRAAFDFIDAIESMTSQQEVIDRLGAELAKYGFHAWLVSGLPNPGERLEPLMMLNGWPPGWTELYTRENFIRYDPCAAHVFRTVNPFEWSEVPYDHSFQPAHQVMERARDFKMLHGFVVPIHSVEGFQAVVTMAGDKVDLSGQAKPACHLMSLYAHAKAAAFGTRQNEQPRQLLTPREREVVQLTAAGKSAWEISVILSISQHTVKHHLRVAAAKLDATNKVATVVQAVRRREITL